MIDRKEYLLTCLSEECMEVGQRASKAIRFSMEEVQPGQEMTNAERICQELDDLLAVIAILNDETSLNYEQNNERILAKVQKIEKFFAYSQSQGCVPR